MLVAKKSFRKIVIRGKMTIEEQILQELKEIKALLTKEEPEKVSLETEYDRLFGSEL